MFWTLGYLMFLDKLFYFITNIVFANVDTLNQIFFPH